MKISKISIAATANLAFALILTAQEASVPPSAEPSGAQAVAPAPTPATAPTPAMAPASPIGGSGTSPIGIGSLGGTNTSENIVSALTGHSEFKDILGKKMDEGEARMFRSRFEKYLNAPAATSAEDLEYNKLLVDINERLAGKGGGSDDARTIDAWKMLFKAQDYPMDGQLCRTIADKVINFWQTTRKTAQLLEQNEKLEKERKSKESAITAASTSDRREFIEMMRDKDATPPPSRDYVTDPLKKRLMETEKKIEENKAYETTSRMSQKLDFQSLIVQFFIQRRYQHALIANDFYRYIFVAEDGKLEGLDSIKSQLFAGADIKLTTSTIDALCKEAINDAQQGADATRYLIERGELHSATQRLMEAFFVGEHLASVKTVPIESKREILRYMRDTDKLINAVKVKHVERAQEILKNIESYVKDFDSGQVEAFIQTSKQLSDLALQKALVAAQTGNQAGIEAALQESVEFWPTNPKIQEFIKTMLGKVDLKDMATVDFDRLITQKDYRAIFNDRFRFAAALAMDPERNGNFLEIMKRMETIETSMAQAKELARLNNNFAAWELVEKVYLKFPEDVELSRLRSDFTVKASSLAAALARAEEARARGDKWEALVSYIAASKIYPMSSFANDNIRSLSAEILAEMRNK